VSGARPAVLALVLAAAAALLLAFITGRGNGTAPVLRTGPISIATTLSPASSQFGDRVEAEVDVYTDGRRVEPGSVKVTASFTPYGAVETRMSRSRRGDISLLRTRYELQCLTRACLPPEGAARAFRLPAATVSYTRDGRPTTTPVAWPELQVSSRVPAGSATPTALADAPPDVDPGFARPPRLVQALLLLAALVLGAAGTALVVSALWPASALARWRRGSPTPLEQSLARVENAARSDDEGERRRTLDDLATKLARVPAPPLETRARTLAWGAAPPAGEELTELAQHVRTALNGSVAH
jgi:hypothetical protein